MIKIPREATFSRFADKITGTDYPCCVCGKACPNPTHMIHMHDGNPPEAVTDQECEDTGESCCLGMYPIGSQCLKKHPELLPYAHVVVKVASEQEIKLDWKALYFDLYRQTHSENAPESEIMADATKRQAIWNNYK